MLKKNLLVGTGRVTQEEMINIFNRSKINLNLSNSVKFNFKYLLDKRVLGEHTYEQRFREIFKIFSKKENVFGKVDFR